jgi:methionine sulfoxide reductase heme-binding subunit
VSQYTDPGHHIFWLASRSLGVVALVLVALSVGMGLAMASGSAKGPGVKARVRQWHEATALAALIAIAAHGLVLLGDSYLRPGLAGISIPFVMAHQPTWTGLGVIGGWLAAIFGLTFYARRWIGARLWRQMHRWTLLVYVLAVMHTLGSGTDARSLWLLAIVVATAIPILVLTAARFLPSDDPAQRRPRRRIPLPNEPLPAYAAGQPAYADPSGYPDYSGYQDEPEYADPRRSPASRQTSEHDRAARRADRESRRRAGAADVRPGGERRPAAPRRAGARAQPAARSA